jgi:hypothetical protein
VEKGCGVGMWRRDVEKVCGEGVWKRGCGEGVWRCLQAEASSLHRNL